LSYPSSLAESRKIFVNSMSDLFHERVSDGFILKVWQVMRETPRHHYQISTKRPERMASVVSTLIDDVLPDVWLGTSIENADVVGRIDHLRAVPAAIRFLSFEPLIGPVGDVSSVRYPLGDRWRRKRSVGAANKRDMDRLKSHLAPGEEQGTVFFFKQWGTWGKDNKRRSKKANGREYRGQTWDGMPSAVSISV